jgi:hypothetical protein
MESFEDELETEMRVKELFKEEKPKKKTNMNKVAWLIAILIGAVVVAGIIYAIDVTYCHQRIGSTIIARCGDR